MRRKWTATEISLLAERYPQEGASRLAAEFTRSPDAITSMARRLRIPSQRHRTRQAIRRAETATTVNARFFDSQNPRVAWCLGVIWGCGNVKTRHRHVLKLTVSASEERLLRTTLAVLGSRHHVRRTVNRLTVEIGNSRLVHGLLTHCGRPPGQTGDDQGLPRLPPAFLRHFAAGLLASAGLCTPQGICWFGTPRTVSELVEEVRRATGVGDPTWDRGKRECRAAWTRPIEVAAIRSWLFAGNDGTPY
jgi:hypothetical protein